MPVRTMCIMKALQHKKVNELSGVSCNSEDAADGADGGSSTPGL